MFRQSRSERYLCRQDSTNILNIVRPYDAGAQDADIYSSSWDVQDLPCPFENRVIANVADQFERAKEAYIIMC